MMFTSHLVQIGLAHPTIKVHVSSGLHSQFALALSPKLEMVMKGIKKEKSLVAPCVRLPITLDIMTKYMEMLNQNPHNRDNIMFWAACCLAFFGFLRCSEFTVPSQSEFCPRTHLTLQDLVIDSRTKPTMIQVTIKQSKTDPFRQGCKLCLGKTGANIFPISAILPYLAARGSCQGPLFILDGGTYLTRQIFTSQLSAVLEQVGIDSKGYNTHSFCIGAATTAKKKGTVDREIFTLKIIHAKNFCGV